MNVNFKTTTELLETIDKYADVKNVKVKTENTNWRGQKYTSDFITIDEEETISFEVFDNEIIVFFFGDHIHFEDYTSSFDYGEYDYITRAKEFFENLFTLPIKFKFVEKGGKVIRSESFFCHSNGNEESIAGVTISFSKNPFAKKQKREELWQFSKQLNKFEKQDC